MSSLRVALAQVNPTVGDLSGNARIIRTAVARAEALGADLVVFPELALCGYPPEDLLHKPHFVRACGEALADLRDCAREAAVLVGFPAAGDEGVYNAAALLCGGDHVATYHKMMLPNYGVFDERRYFVPGEAPLAFELNGVIVGVTICEDVWVPDGLPEHVVRGAGVQLTVNLSSSPYNARKMEERLRVIARFAERTGTTLAYCNLVGGQDELVFDGGSVVMAHEGTVIAQAPHFRGDVLVADVPVPERRGGQPAFRLHSRPGERPPVALTKPHELSLEEEVYAALVLGTRDYLHKNGFRHAVIGLSGGVDSSLVAAIAVDALGVDRVTGVTMPSRYSSEGARSDAVRLAENLGIPCLTAPIEPMFEVYDRELAGVLTDGPPGVEMENLQARIRGNILMTFSNRFGWLVLTTGNKSEIAVGYCTLYGDMAGGFAVIKDVPKTLVYRLARYVNERASRHVIPLAVLERAPSAELRADQKDQDTLPPYDVLDAILEAYVEQDKSRDEIVAGGFDEQTVRDVIRMVDRSEYKRRQGPPGVKITPKAFGRDRRMPITNRFQQH